MMKKCSQMLTKLMKHKGAIWFNTPVDVVGMGLHDYHQIIKSPMDLGTVKSKLSKGFYHSPLEFASDIRLTFKNALVYNPEGHDVHRLADQLLKQFESMFAPAITKHEKQRSAILSAEEDRRQSASSLGRVGSTTKPDPCISLPHHVRTPVQSKAAAANLPDEKMAEVLRIVSRRNETLQNGDEVEIDFEVMDNETLWELDRFVSNWNKMSKTKKRQEIMANGHPNYQDPSSVVAPPSPAPPPEVDSKPPVPAAETPEALAAKKSKKGDPVDEEVDIGDDMPAIHYPSVEIEKESSSSSSGSDSSSSSSDSDSGSSSGSDSDDDDDEARSLPVGSKPSPRS
ncbi:transcription factor GTE7-like [Asparagus officinalis]|uniref:transcription factor GTE7-like n=1 Tax=Asparagus officinalis TaxID=4686 RepID=UPI00098E1C7F|nr:transcription factor GTE7-like [Asparagus officinalis]